ncbi:hypothetical protein DCAR_0624610 [Daucus carota subsp. sativus]|uniref:Uncharacterized protein n=1 Tax=Daucus carota subsp. sativus TaxID=79200 RepID=A0A175YA28_DAUCS|nr:hypothetical protein DCAR_0624610 [Daucus carota subsp. sativus]
MYSRLFEEVEYALSHNTPKKDFSDHHVPCFTSNNKSKMIKGRTILITIYLKRSGAKE